MFDNTLRSLLVSLAPIFALTNPVQADISEQMEGHPYVTSGDDQLSFAFAFSGGPLFEMSYTPATEIPFPYCLYISNDGQEIDSYVDLHCDNSLDQVRFDGMRVSFNETDVEQFVAFRLMFADLLELTRTYRQVRRYSPGEPVPALQHTWNQDLLSKLTEYIPRTTLSERDGDTWSFRYLTTIDGGYTHLSFKLDSGSPHNCQLWESPRWITMIHIDAGCDGRFEEYVMNPADPLILPATDEMALPVFDKLKDLERLVDFAVEHFPAQ